MTVVDIINLGAGFASLILSIVAIWLSLHFYDKAKDSEKQTAVNVDSLKTQTQILVDISGRMLDKFTDYSTQPKAADETFLIMAKLASGVNLNAITAAYPANNDADKLAQYAVDITIAAHFYAGAANLGIQDALPYRLADVPADSNLPGFLDASYTDYTDLSNKLRTMEGVTDSSIYHVYQVASGWEGSGAIKNGAMLYTVPIDE